MCLSSYFVSIPTDEKIERAAKCLAFTLHSLFYGRNKSVFGYKNTDNKEVENQARMWSLHRKEKQMEKDIKNLSTNTNRLTSTVYSFAKISRSRQLFGDNNDGAWYFTDKCYVLAKLAFYFSVDTEYTRSLISFSRMNEKFVGFRFYSELI